MTEIKPKIGMNKDDYQKNHESTSINHFYENFLEEFKAEWEGQKWYEKK